MTVTYSLRGCESVLCQLHNGDGISGQHKAVEVPGRKFHPELVRSHGHHQYTGTESGQCACFRRWV